MKRLELFRNYPHRKIAAGVITRNDIAGFGSSYRLPQYAVLQLKDITDPSRHVVLTFDLEGRLTNILMQERGLANEAFILERNFNGRFYLYTENHKNLEPGHDGVDLFVDYWNKFVGSDNETAKFLVDSVHNLLLQLSAVQYKTNGQLTFTKVDGETLTHDPVNVSKLDERVAAILAKAQKNYGWKGLTANKLYYDAYPTPITVLPPDLRPDQTPTYAVIQTVSGCPRMRTGKACGFCASYNGIQYREKTLTELNSHIGKVKQFHGAGWPYIKRVFLSDGDPLNTISIDAATYLESIDEAIPGLIGMRSFVSTMTILSKPVDEWITLMGKGLEGVYWGVESADDATLHMLGKHHNQKMLYEAVQRLEESEVPYAIIVMSGIGALDPDRTARQVTGNSHVSSTTRFIERANPFNIYISKFMPVPGTPIYDLIQAGKLKELTPEELDKQHHTMVNNLFPREVKGEYGQQFV